MDPHTYISTIGMSEGDVLMGSNIEGIPPPLPPSGKVRSQQMPYDDPTPETCLSKNRPTIRMGVKLVKLTDIDYVSGSFNLSCNVLLEWHDPKNIGKKKGTNVGAKLDGERLSVKPKETSPVPRWENAKDGAIVFHEGQSLQPTCVDDKGRTKMQLSVSVCLYKTMELQSYPCDVQELCMDIRFPHAFDNTDIDRLAMNEAGDCVTFDDEFMLLEYQLRKPYIALKYPCTIKQGKRQDPKPMFRLVIPIQRAHWHYIIHIISVSGTLTTANALCFLIPPAELAERANITLTLFLTIVATKFLIGERLPQLPFLTMIDVYFVASGVFFILILLESASIKFCLQREWITEEESSRFDGWYAVFWLVSLLIFNVAMLVRIRKLLNKHDAEMPPFICKAGQAIKNFAKKE